MLFQKIIDRRIRPLAHFARVVADLPPFQPEAMAAAAVVFFKHSAAGNERGLSIASTVDVFGGGWIGDEADDERDDRFTFLGTEWKLRHAEPFVIALVSGLVVIVA